jgi:hypothetical protein
MPAAKIKQRAHPLAGRAEDEEAAVVVLGIDSLRVADRVDVVMWRLLVRVYLIAAALKVI